MAEVVINSKTDGNDVIVSKEDVITIEKLKIISEIAPIKVEN